MEKFLKCFLWKPIFISHCNSSKGCHLPRGGWQSPAFLPRHPHLGGCSMTPPAFWYVHAHPPPWRTHLHGSLHGSDTHLAAEEAISSYHTASAQVGGAYLLDMAGGDTWNLSSPSLRASDGGGQLGPGRAAPPGDHAAWIVS